MQEIILRKISFNTVNYQIHCIWLYFYDMYKSLNAHGLRVACCICVSTCVTGWFGCGRHQGHPGASTNSKVVAAGECGWVRMGACICTCMFIQCHRLLHTLSMKSGELIVSNTYVADSMMKAYVAETSCNQLSLILLYIAYNTCCMYICIRNESNLHLIYWSDTWVHVCMC